MYMNSGEIMMYARECAGHPVLGPATRFLEILMEHTNDCSDGWHSWPAPSHAAQQLQELIKNNTGGWGHPQSAISITLKDVEKTLTPIRRMATVQEEKQKKYGNKYHFDVDAAWKEAKGEDDAQVSDMQLSMPL